jgi:hypothetical protein
MVRKAQTVTDPGESTYNLFRKGTLYYAKASSESGLADHPGTDGSTVLQAAITEAPAGSTIRIKSAIWPCHNVILKDDLDLEGESCIGTVLQLDANDYLLKSHTDPTAAPPITGVHLRRLGFDGNKATFATGKSLIYGGFINCGFEHLRLVQGHEHNIELIRQDATFSYNLRFIDVESKQSDQSALHANRITDSEIIGGYYHSTTLSAVHIQAGAVWKIIGPYIGNARVNGLWLQTCGQSVVESCQLDWSDADTVLLEDSYQTAVEHNRIYREGAPAATGNAIRLHDSFDCQIKDNQFGYDGGNQWAVGILEEGGGSYDNDIEGNVIPTAACSGARITRAAATSIIQHNVGHRTDATLLSATFLIDAVAVLTITTAHGLAITPRAQDVWITIEQVTAVDDFVIGFAKVVSTDATNVVCKVRVTTASATASSTAKLNILITRH